MVMIYLGILRSYWFQQDVGAFVPRYKCGASLQTCSSVRSQRWGFSPPGDGAAPVWCYQAPQTLCRRHVQAGEPSHSLWPPAHPDRAQWPSPCQEQQLRCGSASPASTGVQGPPGGGVRSSRATLQVEFDKIYRNPLMENKVIKKKPIISQNHSLMLYQEQDFFPPEDSG